MSLERLNSVYNAFITIQTRKEAVGPLSGLTFGVKDIIETKGIRTTAGSRLLEGYIPKSDAWIVRRILDLGGEILGKTNTHEFAIGATNTSSVAGPARNPRDPERISGGSSGGSAVAVALKMTDIGVGSDTGGSVRIPASLCGVIGFKPTYGIIPTQGVIPFSWSLDTLGFLTRDVETMWNTLNWVIPQENKKVLLSTSKTEIRVGLFLFDESQISRLMLEKVREFFPNFKELHLPLMERLGSEVRRTIASSEGSSYHLSNLNSRAELYFPDVRESLESGLRVRAVDYINALRVRRLILEEYVKAFEEVDVVVSPTTKITAPKISEVVGREKEYRSKLVANTELFNLVGAPSLSVPFMEVEGLPVGLMLSGMPFADGTVLDLARYILSSN
ncbi:amidase [Metallosphaera tengchongensis]|uniref:Amidase n=1 Tax=Metallosphaera tengchongensis TaxID=1532350 RepID=A0A6N0NW48_9CREN|nr:amidase [Metallosphaera tengchongensis]QKR00435.1 amidase [Metallosphaera tengchongensis]